MNATPVIEIVGVSKRFPGVVALDDVQVAIAAGEFHALVGENGAGKSTLMKILAGVIADYEGQLRLRGQTRRFADTRAAEAAGIRIIHQELNLVDDLSVAANIFLGREIHNRWGLLDERAMQRQAAGLLAELECQVPVWQSVRALRVGDQQLVEIAKALSQECDVLIMDEPTSALTEAEVQRLDRVIARLRQRGVTIVYISHKLDEIFRLADRITVLRDGQVVRTLDRQKTTPREITHLMVGRELEAAAVMSPRTPGEVRLEVRDLSLPPAPGSPRWRLQNVSFQLRAGEVVGIAGLLGAGRTELLECLFGAAPRPPLGEIRLGGEVVRLEHPGQAVARGVALVSEDRKRLGLFAQLDVADNINLCTLPATRRGGLLSPEKQLIQAEDMIERVGVKTPHAHFPITGLSGGNQQKAIIGRWLLTQPSVLLLDDPTRGVDVGAKSELYQLIDRLCHEGLAVLVTSSELPELLTLCDRILVLCEGRLTGEFSRAEATEHAIMEAATSRVG